MASEEIKLHLLNEFWTLTDEISAANVTSSKKQQAALLLLHELTSSH